MHVKVGDTVQVISGREKGKIGEITRIFRHNSTVIIKDMNLKTKHMKSREQGEPGQIVKVHIFYVAYTCMPYNYLPMLFFLHLASSNLQLHV